MMPSSRSRPSRATWFAALLMACAIVPAAPLAAAPIHTSYLWHMHQPIYWPERSTWNGNSYETAYETITLGHSQSDVFDVFNKDDRVHDYQDYPKTAIQSVLDLPDAGAQVSFAGALIQNLSSLGAAGWNGGRYAPNWYQPYRDARGWTTSGGLPRLDPLIVGFHHPIAPLVDDAVFRRMLETQKSIMPSAWGAGPLSAGFFPAEMCFSERLIPALVAEGVQWAVVPDLHIARACANYPYAANQDNCDPPNPADQVNPAQNFYTSQSISRGVTVKVPAPYALRPHQAQYVDPATGAVSKLVVVPAATAMSWNEGYGSYGTGEIDAIASHNDPAKPMLILFAHDGDNDWAGGNSYYTQNVTQFAHAAAAAGYEPTTIAQYLADHPVASDDVVHVEDGGWVNADGDFGSPQFINWNWPLVDASGAFDIPNGWAEDERNWAVLTAATNRVLTAEQIAGAPDVSRIVDPTLPGATALEHAWHFLLAGFESGYMYYGTALDFEIKPTLAANRAVEFADSLLAGGTDLTAPTVWLPQRLPWNPGGTGGGSLWGYPGGVGAPMSRDFSVWTFVSDVSGVASVDLMVRIDGDGVNPPGSIQNETYAGGPEVGAWQRIAMTQRAFPAGNFLNDPSIDFTVMPTYIADEYWVQLTGYSNQLLDYYVEAADTHGNVRRSPIQHVWVGDGDVSQPGAAVRWSPAAPVAGGTLTIEYDAVAGALPDAASPVYVHVGHSGWADIVTPDPVMTWNPDSLRWTYTYAIPASATSVDFVFNDGSSWDNNGGADWHVAVSGGTQPEPGFTIDGALDAGLTPRASCGGLDLYAEYDGRWLYVAAPSAATTTGLDHFIFVARSTTSGTAPAPWAKSGTVAAYDRMLGNEESSGWSGWFDAAGGQPTTGLSQQAGAWLEGLVDVEAVWGTAPDTIHVALATYGTADGGALSGQAPCGNGDGDLQASERITVVKPAVTAVTTPPPPGLDPIRLLGANPTRGALRARVNLGAVGRATVDLMDVRGRRLARLHDGPATGPFEVAADLARIADGPGVYFLVARGSRGAWSRRVAFVR